MKNIEPKLKPCPYCGGKAEIQGITTVWIVCKKCRIATSSYKEEARAIEVWNRRVTE